MKRRHARPFMAHPLPTEREVWAFSVFEFLLAGIAAVIAAPLIWAFSVLFLTAAGQ